MTAPAPADAHPGGPLPLTVRQSAVAAILALVVGLGAALLTPIAAAFQASRVVPPGAVVVGQASVLPAPGWTVEQRAADAVLLTRSGAQVVVHWAPGAPPADPAESLGALAAATQRLVPEARSFGSPRRFTSPSGEPGYLAPFAAPGSTGAIAIVVGRQGQAHVQALAPSTTFASLADDVLGMITGIRIVDRGSP